MKRVSVLKRAVLIILCATMVLCFASCKKTEESLDFVTEKNDISVGADDFSGTEKDDISSAPQKGEDEKTPAQDQEDDSEKADTDSKPDAKPDTDNKTDGEKPTDGTKKDPASCSHSWKNATCEVPKTCSKCGATEGEAAGHKWKDGNCEAPKTCTVCGATDGDQPVHKYKKGLCSCGAREWGYGAWVYVKAEDKTIYVNTLNFDEDEFSSFEYHTVDTFDGGDKEDNEEENGEEKEENNEEDTPAVEVESYTYKDVKYLQYDGTNDPVIYAISGETITVQLPGGGTFTMSKSGKTKATVTEVNEVDPSLYIAVGVTFEYGI